MIRFIIRNLYASTIYREGTNPVRRAHAGLKLIAFTAVIASGFVTDRLPILAILFAYPIAVGIIDDVRILVYSFKAPLIPAVLVGVFTALLSPTGPLSSQALMAGARLALRLLLMAMLLTLYMATTHPQRLVALLSTARTPLWLTEAVEVSWRLIPLTLRDTDEALAAIRLKGLKPWKALAPVTAVTLSRARGLAETMYVRGLGLTPRKKTLRTAGEVREAIPLLLAAFFMVLTSMILTS